MKVSWASFDATDYGIDDEFVEWAKVAKGFDDEPYWRRNSIKKWSSCWKIWFIVKGLVNNRSFKEDFMRLRAVASTLQQKVDTMANIEESFDFSNADEAERMLEPVFQCMLQW